MFNNESYFCSVCWECRSNWLLQSITHWSAIDLALISVSIPFEEKGAQLSHLKNHVPLFCPRPHLRSICHCSLRQWLLDINTRIHRNESMIVRMSGIFSMRLAISTHILWASPGRYSLAVGAIELTSRGTNVCIMIEMYSLSPAVQRRRSLLPRTRTALDEWKIISDGLLCGVRCD